MPKMNTVYLFLLVKEYQNDVVGFQNTGQAFAEGSKTYP